MASSSSGFIRTLRTIHGWLGFFVLPWIIIIGLTGLYLNHSDLVLKYLPNQDYNEADFDKWPNPQPISLMDAETLATRIFAAEPFRTRTTQSYHNRAAWRFQTPAGSEVIVDKATAHYWVKQGYTRVTYDPDGRQVDYKYYYGSLFKTIHTKGWSSSVLGTLLADIAASAMVVFGMSGFFMFLASRFGRRGSTAPAPMVAPAARKPEPQAGSAPRPRRIRPD